MAMQSVRRSRAVRRSTSLLAVVVSVMVVAGLLAAAAVIAPDLELFFWFIPVTVKMLAIGGLLLAAYQVFASGQNAGGQAAHLGGGLLGFALMKNQHWLNPFAPTRQTYEYVAAGRRRRRSRAFQKDWSKDPNR